MKHHQIPYNYVVFLSFRGKDTRKKFTDHLYNALKSAGIHTFRDNNEIDSGADIEEECLKAIEESRFSLVVLSKGYASSTWCLDELVHIMKCRRELGQTVWPVFYDVDPTDVEELSGSFGEGFVEAEKRSVDDLERVGRWKDALRQVVYLKGLDLPNHADGHEAENIKHIVDVISDKLNHKSLIAARHPVGLEPRAERVIALLCKKSVVSICGMGGIGKTTIAKEVYNCISRDFEGSCFLENVRSSSDTKGIKKLQRQLLSKILKRKHEKIDNVDQGVNIIQERLCRKKVFIVIDDVDRLGQIHKILGDLDWICPGSKVVITTRTQDLLPPSRSCAQYEVQELSDVDSLRLFSLYAFNECSPFEDYASLAERVVSYAGGNPLALEVLGSSLRGENVDIWRSKLEKLMLIGHKDVHNILKISFDSLDNMDKFLFLDIACFFIGKNKDYVMSILDDCGFCTVDGLNTLRKRCLISIGDKKKLMMHDLIRDMGRDIVFGDPPILDPGKRSRLWHHDDAIDVLENQLGTEAVEGLVLNSPGSNYSFETKAFKRMTRLRLLQINYIVLSGSFKYVSSKLRWLCWRESSLESLPVDLNLENLVALDMRYSSLRRFSEEVKHLKKLKFLNLNHSHRLEKTPNFEGLPSLQMLLLKDCTNLMEVHHSIGHLTHLVSLNLQDCQSLKNLPETLSNLRSLETLNLSGCTNLEELPEDLGTLKSLGVLLLDGTAITRVPKSIADLENLRSLSLRDCPLIFSPTEGSRVFSILPSSLQTLDIQYCNISENAIPQNLDLGLPLLRIMKLCGNNFQSLPTSIAGLPMLHTLWLNDCRDLRVVPQLQPTLQKFHAQNCPLLESIDLTDIRGESDIELSGCSNLKEVKGYYSLEPLEVGIVNRLLKTGGSFIGETLANPCVRMLDNLTNTYRIRDPQALSERGLYSIFLPGSHIPTWFSYQSEGDYLSFDVPPLRQGSKIIGFVTCAIYAWEAYNKACYFTTSINIINKTKNFCWSYTPYITFLSSEVDRDIMWMCYWMFENQKEGIDTFDMGWRFKYELEQGDELIFFIDMGYGITVKRCGLHFLCLQAAGKRDILSNDITIVSHASSRNNRRFLKSRPRWLKIDHQHKIKVEEMSNPFHDSDFMRWTKQLGERLNQTPDYDYKYVRPSQLTMNLVSETSSSFKKKKVREETEKKEENTKLIPFVPHPSLESTEPEIHDKAIEDSRNEDIPMKEKVVYVEPTTEPLVDAEPLSTKYKAKSEVETGSSSSLSSSIGHIDIKVSLPRSKLSSSFDSGSSSGSQTISGNRLAELSSKIRRPRPPLIGSKVSGSSKALTPNFVQQQREALSHYLNMSLEDVEKAKKFEEIESIVLLLAQNTTNLYEKIKLDDLVSRLVELKETVASNVTLAISAEAERETIDAKATDISTRLMQQQEQLSSLEAEFSRLSEEETELDTQIQRLIEKREEVVAQKNLVAREWEETKQEEEKQLDEWDNLEMEVRQTNENWVRTKETLAQANAKWELIKENLK